LEARHPGLEPRRRWEAGVEEGPRHSAKSSGRPAWTALNKVVELRLGGAVVRAHTELRTTALVKINHLQLQTSVGVVQFGITLYLVFLEKETNV
jgi:hypothetical protein